MTEYSFRYCQFMQPICLRKDWPAKFEDVCGLHRPLSDDDVLDGHQEHSQDSFVVPLACPFYSQLPSTAVPTDGGALVRVVELSLPSSGFFSMRLFTLLQDVYASINKARYIWPPCASFIMTERCPERDDCGRDHIISGHLQHLKDRIIFWSSLLPLCNQLHWLAGRLHHRKYEFDECRRFRRMVLDAFVSVSIHP